MYDSQIPRPVTGVERLRELDILRGVALLGILVVNIESFAGPEGWHDIPIGVAKAAFTGWHAQLDLVLLALKWVFVEAKMRGLFTILFGASAVLLTSRFEAKLGPKQARVIYFRRTLWLLVFGLIHGCLLWPGDILTIYALAGLLVPWFARRLSGKTLIALGLAIWMFSAVVGVPRFVDSLYGSNLPGHSVVPTSIAQMFKHPASTEVEEARKAVVQLTVQAQSDAEEARSTGYLATVPTQALGFLQLCFLAVVTGFFAANVGIMLFGMGLFELGLLAANRSVGFYAALAIAGYAITATLVLLGIYKSQQSGFGIATTMAWMYLPYGFEQFTGTIASVALILLCIKLSLFPRAFKALGAVGQTAFSNYIFTTLLCQSLFVWGPWALYGELEYYQQVYVIVGVWALNLLSSWLWLRRFYFGPLEWVWRSLTYWRRQPLLRAALLTPAVMGQG